MSSLKYLLLLALGIQLPLAAGAAEQALNESAKVIPLAYEVDVVVVGGTSRGVAAAVAAAEKGATVFLAAPRPYLGEDLCAPYRLWLDEGESPESALGQAMFSAKPPSGRAVARGLPFSYSSSIPAAAKHPDRKNSLLYDGRAGSAATESVQYDGEVRIIADLGSLQALKSVQLLAYQRPADFSLAAFSLSASADKKAWQPIGDSKNPKLDKGGFETDPIEIRLDKTFQARYLRLDIRRGPKAGRVLLGEIIVQGKKPLLPAPVETLRVTTPMTVKRALDDALLAAGVHFLYGSYLSDLIQDKEGNLSGIVIANRSGRQAVSGKVIIDASNRGIAGRLAGARFGDYPKTARFSRIVVGGNPGKAAKLLPLSYSIGTKDYKVYEYNFDLPMADSSWAAFARADQTARNRSWQTGQVAASEGLFQLPPDPVKAVKKWTGAWPGAGELDLNCLRPEGIQHLYLLGGCADMPRPAAAQLMRPLNGIALGRRVGAAAAEDAKKRQLRQPLTLGGKPAADGIKADIGEMLNGIRAQPVTSARAMVNSPERALPVIGRYDTVVVGGGTGGAPAGVGAARGGARTLVVEYLHGLGGVGTLGRISKYYHGNRVGFTTEVDKGVVSMAGPGAALQRGGWNIENKMEWLRSEIAKAGGQVWFQTLAVGSVVKDKKFIGVILATPHGRGVVLANTVIDATGNAVIPACAGLETQAIGAEHISVQGTGLPPYTPGESYLNSDWTFTDDDDVLDMWRIHVVGRRKYAGAFDTGQLIDTRARRRIVGDIMVSPMDIINRRVYPDVITVSKSNFDNHGFSSHTLFMITPPDKTGLVANVPYRALLPKDYDGILVTGLGMSAHGDAMPVMRMQADVQNQGYAAGRASAMAAESGSTVRQIKVKALQQHLVEKGIIPKGMIGAEDSYPVSKDRMLSAVITIAADYSGIALVLTNPEMAKPMLREAWENAKNNESKLRYAHVLGMLYDPIGAETLALAVTAAEWDKGWNFRGMGQFGATTSPLDNLIIALGRTRDKKALAPVLQKLAQLTSRSEFSHCRAVAVALETLKDPAAANPLAGFLQQPGLSGHAYTEIHDVIRRTPANKNDNSTRNNSLRELVLARALFRCGDHQGIGEKILRQYAADFRGHYASHAKAVLGEKR